MILLIILGLSLALAVGGGATYVWLTETDGWAMIASHPLPVAASAGVALLLTCFNLLLRWLRWNFLLRRFHMRVPTRETFRLFFTTLAAVATPFYLGELLRGALIARRHRRLVPVVFWVWVVERCSDVAALLAVWGFASGRMAMCAAGLSLLVGAPWLLARRTLGGAAPQKLHTGQLHAAWVVSLCSGASLIAWTLPILAMQLVLALLDGGTAFAVVSEAFSAGTLLGGISGIPGGLGAVGSTMILRLVSAGVDASIASTTVLVMRLCTQWFSIALGVVLLVLWRRHLVQMLRTATGDQQHFDELSSSYADNIPEHVRQRLLSRKLDAMAPLLPQESHGRPLRGLDLGCGQGWYAAALAGRGCEMSGIDLSQGQVARALEHCRDQGAGVDLRVYDGVRIPYDDASFDFAYSINVLHHITTPDAQVQMLAEILRVLKPGGLFHLHEMNIENPLFRGYMSYVFPLLKSIDEGTELWMRPTQLPAVEGGTWRDSVAYFTFLPEFLPPLVQRVAEPVERVLEASSLRRFSAHYMATLERTR